MNPALKHVAEKSLLASGLPKFARRFRRGQAVVLAYHNVVPDDYPKSGDCPLHLRLSAFRAQLDYLKETHDLVTLETLRRDDREYENRPAAAITFDDAYAGALEIGIPEIVARGMPATVFVSPGLLGSNGFWWDLLADSGSGGLDSRLRSRALTELGGRQETVLSSAREQGMGIVDLPELLRPSDHATVVRTGREPGITLGSHTWTHPNLTGLEAGSLHAELEQSRTWLEEHSPASAVSWLAYPYGLHDEKARTIAESTGFSGGLTGSRGWASLPLVDPFSVPRLNVSAGLSEAGFLLNVSGVPVI